MDHKKDQEFEQTLAESEFLLRGAARSASDDADLTLESILAEFGTECAELFLRPAVRAAGGGIVRHARAGHRESAGGA